MSCKIGNVQRNRYKDLYTSEFKMTYFKMLIERAYNHSPCVEDLLKKDKSSFTEPLLSREDYTLLKKVVENDNAWLVKDSIESYSTRAEGANGKAIFKYALEKYTRTWLDSIADRQLKSYLKTNYP